MDAETPACAGAGEFSMTVGEVGYFALARRRGVACAAGFILQ